MIDKTKKTLSLVGNIALILFLVFAVVVTIFATVSATSSDGIPSIGNNAFFNIQTNSMDSKNGFGSGSMIVANKLAESEKANLVVGDVITFRIENQELNTHRIVEVSVGANGKRLFATRGDLWDNMTNPETNLPFTWADKATWDSNENGMPIYISEELVVAKWGSMENGQFKKGTAIAGLGAFLNFTTSKVGFLCLIVLPLLVFFVFELINIIRLIRKAKGKKTITADDEEEIKRRAIEEYLKSQGVVAGAETQGDVAVAETQSEVVVAETQSEVVVAETQSEVVVAETQGDTSSENISQQESSTDDISQQNVSTDGIGDISTDNDKNEE